MARPILPRPSVGDITFEHETNQEGSGDADTLVDGTARDDSYNEPSGHDQTLTNRKHNVEQIERIHSPPLTYLPIMSEPGQPRDIGRRALFISDALRKASDARDLHDMTVEAEMARFYRQLDEYCRLAERKNGVPRQQTRELVLNQCLRRAHYLQTRLVEPVVGRFTHYENSYVQSQVQFESRLLAVMMLGLVQQATQAPVQADMVGKSRMDIDASCELEARSWLIDWIRSLTAQLASAHER